MARKKPVVFEQTSKKRWMAYSPERVSSESWTEKNHRVKHYGHIEQIGEKYLWVMADESDLGITDDFDEAKAEIKARTGSIKKRVRR